MSDDNPPRAADGAALRPAASTLGEFIRLIEDGDFDAECYDDLKEMQTDMHNCATAGNGIANGELTIKIKFKLEGAVFHIAAAHAIKTDKPKRPRSVMWCLPDGRFTPHKPYQGELFGVRDVSGSTEVRRTF